VLVLAILIFAGSKPLRRPMDIKRSSVGVGPSKRFGRKQLDGKAVDWMEHVSDEQYLP
jgi:hypothetical protein